MSNLGSIGSKDFVPAAAPTPSSPVLPSAADNQNATSQVLSLFQSPNPTDHTAAMKMLLAMMSKGHNVADFSAYVVQQVASTDPLCRQLAYVFLNHYAEDSPETAILSVNTFQRSLTDSDPMVRALALKVMSSIRTPEILPAIHDAVNQVIGDPSPYVKKAAAYAMIKAAEIDPKEIEGYLPLLERLFQDNSPITFSGAIASYWVLCPNNISMLHSNFRSICQNISKFDEWTQIFTMRALTVYARFCFKNPSESDQEGTDAFWDESAQKESTSADHLTLIHAAKQLLMSQNAAVVMAAVTLLFYSAPSSHITAVARPLVRLIYDTSLTAQLALSAILTIASLHSHIFIPHLNHFFIRRSDSSQIRTLKLKILSRLAVTSNADQILNELSLYTGSSDRQFAASAVKTMGKTAIVNQNIIPNCLVSLLRLMGNSEGIVLSEVVLVTAQILRKKRGTDDEAFCLRQLCRKFLNIKDPSARAAVLSIVGDMHETHPEFAPQLLRYVAKNFVEESPEVKLQTLTLAAKLLAAGGEEKVPKYVLKVGERDSEFDVRDRARFLQGLVGSEVTEIKENLKGLLFPVRGEMAGDIEGSEFVMGTFSHFFNRVLAGYDGLPEWASEEDLPDESVRVSVRMVDGEREEEREPEEGFSDFFSEDHDEEEEYYEEEEEEAEYYSEGEAEEEDQAADDFFD